MEISTTRKADSLILSLPFFNITYLFIFVIFNKFFKVFKQRAFIDLGKLAYVGNGGVFQHDFTHRRLCRFKPAVNLNKLVKQPRIFVHYFGCLCTTVKFHSITSLERIADGKQPARLVCSLFGIIAKSYKSVFMITEIIRLVHNRRLKFSKNIINLILHKMQFNDIICINLF